MHEAMTICRQDRAHQSNGPKSRDQLSIEEMLRLADSFWEKLTEVKRNRNPADFEWYPNDFRSSIAPLAGLLTGKRRALLSLTEGAPVLDVGCADGDISFFFESLGCAVHAIDHPAPNFNRMLGVQALRAALDSHVEVLESNIDVDLKLPRQEYGLVLLLGVLYHLRNPYFVLEKLAGHARYCLLNTRVAKYSAAGGVRIDALPVAYLLDRKELNDDSTNYWVFSEAGLRRILERTGWEICDYVTSGDLDYSTPTGTVHDERAYCLVRSRHLTEPGDDATLVEGWHAPEERSRRWTARRFTALLETPRKSSSAVLWLRFSIPDSIFRETGPMTLSVRLNASALRRQRYTAPGDYCYVERIPRRLLRGENSPNEVDFEFDRALPPDDADPRERSVVVSAIGLRPAQPGLHRRIWRRVRKALGQAPGGPRGLRNQLW